MRKLLLASVVALGLSACASPVKTTSGAAASFNGEWKIVKVNGKDVAPASKASLAFDAKTMKLSGFDGCNRVMGSVTEEGQVLKGMLASTMMACMGDDNSAISQAVGEAFSTGSTVQVLEADKLIELKTKENTITLSK